MDQKLSAANDPCSYGSTARPSLTPWQSGWQALHAPTNYKCPGHIHKHHVNSTQKHSAELRVGLKRYSCFCS